MKEIVLVMVVATLLSSFAFAQYGTGGTTTGGTTGIGINTGVNTETNGNTNIDLNTNVNLDSDVDSDYKDTLVDLNADVDSSVSRISQTYVANGFGWAVQGDSGMFARIMIAERALATADGNDYTLAQGILQLENGATYKLTHDSREQGNDEYSVWMNGNYIGVLDIDDKEEYGNFVVWRGNLKMDDQSNYRIEFAVNSKWVNEDIDGRARVDTELDAAIMNEKTNLRGWTKIKSWFSSDNY